MAVQQGAGIQISPDGNWWWDGRQWQSTLSPDGSMRWNGQLWQPVAAAAPAAPAAALQSSGPGAGAVEAARNRFTAAHRPLVVGLAAAGITALVLTVPALVLSHVGIGAPAYAATVKLAFHQSQVDHYSVHQTLDGVLTLPSGQTSPTKADLTASETLKVLSIDKNGVATISATTDGFKGTVNGQPVASNAQKPVTLQFQLGPDGRILAGGSGASTGGGSTGSLPGSDQFSSILPDHKAKPGDTWKKSFDRPNPMGPGSIHYDTTNTLLRYEDIQGVNTAVVETKAVIPLDLTFDLQKLMQVAGSAQQGMPAGSKVHYTGSMSTTTTSWVDVHAQSLLKSKQSGKFDMAMTFEGLPKGPLTGSFHFKGSQTEDLEHS